MFFYLGAALGMEVNSPQVVAN